MLGNWYDDLNELKKKVKKLERQMCCMPSSSLLAGAVIAGGAGSSEDIWAIYHEDADRYGYMYTSQLIVKCSEFPMANPLGDGNFNVTRRVVVGGDKFYLIPENYPFTHLQETSDFSTFNQVKSPHFFTQWTDVYAWQNTGTKEFVIVPNNLDIAGIIYYSNTSGLNGTMDFSSLGVDTSSDWDTYEASTFTGFGEVTQGIVNGIPTIYWNGPAAPDGNGMYYWENDTWNFSGLAVQPTGNGMFNLSNGALVFKGAGTTCYISEDGKSWTTFTLPATTSAAYRFLEWSGDKYVYVADANTIYTSTDLTVWTARVSAFAGVSNMLSVYLCGSTLIATRNVNSTTVIYSSDGITWNLSHASLANAVWGYAASVDGMFLIFEINGTRTYSSTDLTAAFTSRSTITGVSESACLGGVAVYGDKYISSNFNSNADFTYYNGTTFVEVDGAGFSENMCYLDSIALSTKVLLYP